MWNFKDSEKLEDMSTEKILILEIFSVLVFVVVLCLTSMIFPMSSYGEEFAHQTIPVTILEYGPQNPDLPPKVVSGRSVPVRQNDVGYEGHHPTTKMSSEEKRNPVMDKEFIIVTPGVVRLKDTRIIVTRKGPNKYFVEWSPEQSEKSSSAAGGMIEFITYDWALLYAKGLKEELLFFGLTP